MRYNRGIRTTHLVHINADDSRGGRVFTGVCLSDLMHDNSKTNAVRITKRDAQMFYDEFWKPIYYGIKRSKVKFTSHKNSAGVGHCTLVSAGFF